MEMDFGLSTCLLIVLKFWSRCYFLRKAVRDLAKRSVQVVLPVFVSPTIITPKRTLNVSKS